MGQNQSASAPRRQRNPEDLCLPEGRVAQLRSAHAAIGALLAEHEATNSNAPSSGGTSSSTNTQQSSVNGTVKAQNANAATLADTGNMKANVVSPLQQKTPVTGQSISSINENTVPPNAVQGANISNGLAQKKNAVYLN